MIGTKLANYEITNHLGSGGMGDVYQAIDSRLGRSVAIKLLPEAFMNDADRAARFEREARVLASLNHPNIATIHGIEESGGRKFLVMELVRGETLAERIKRGPIPVDESLGIAKQICEALEAAHDKGIIHRDLKPANVKVTPDGKVKVLDFGLAKAFEVETSNLALSNSPTLSMAATNAGVILGTAAYMSPEQARGKPVNKATDIFAFGAVLYELFTGNQAFRGDDVSDILAAVLKTEPDWSLLPETVPPAIRTLLKRCLKKDRHQRLQDATDVRIEIEDAIAAPKDSGPTQSAPASTSKSPWAVGAVAVALAFVAAVMAFGWWRASRPVERPLMRLDADLGLELSPGEGAGSTLAISPDGRRLAFISLGSGTKVRLALRLLDNSQTNVLAGTEGAESPFFSPDSRWIGFFADGKLKKISVEGGAPVTLTNARNPRGAVWGEDGNILFAGENRVGLSRIPDSGGTPQPATELDAQEGEISNRFPQLLPGGDAILFTARTAQEGWNDASIKVLSVKTGKRKTLTKGGYYGRYLPSGHLVYMRDGTLFAAPMNLSRLELTGPASPIVQDMGHEAGNGFSKFDFTASGTFVYVPEQNSAAQRSFFLMDASGAKQPLGVPADRYSAAVLSPDGTHLGFQINDNAGTHLGIYDLVRNRTSRIADFKGLIYSAIWTPDGKHLVFAAGENQLAGPGIYWMRADGATEPQRLLEGLRWLPSSFSPNGKQLAYWHGEPPYGLWTLPLDLAEPEHPKMGKPESLLPSKVELRGPMISPDGRWMSYSSYETGKQESYVRPYPGPGRELQISTGGGTIPSWFPKNMELFYMSPDGRHRVVAYSIVGDSFSASQPRLWSEKEPSLRDITGIATEFLPDGTRLVISLPSEPPADHKPPHVVFLLNFFDYLCQRVPVGK
jgi:serine/threonine-protein kinase